MAEYINVEKSKKEILQTKKNLVRQQKAGNTKMEITINALLKYCEDMGDAIGEIDTLRKILKRRNTQLEEIKEKHAAELVKKYKKIRFYADEIKDLKKKLEDEKKKLQVEVEHVSGGNGKGHYFLKLAGTDFVLTEQSHPDTPIKFDDELGSGGKDKAQKLAARLSE